MHSQWIRRRVLILVRTYPVPAKQGIEVSCTAAITEDRSWIRLFPVPYRFLEEDQRFTQYQWIDVDVIRAKGDSRPESYKLKPDTIQICGSVSASNEWRERRRLLGPLMRESMCAIRRERDQRGFPTLGLVKPGEIKRLKIEPINPAWTPKELACLRQTDMFRDSPPTELEKVPFSFRYEFRCSDTECPGHNMVCTDWEMGQAYRKWKQKYGTKWEDAFRARFEADMIRKYDTHFYVGTVHQHPGAWIIVGLFYPPPEMSPELPF